MNNQKKSGFTLVELIVCLALLTIILGAIGNMFVPVLNNYYTINTDVNYQNTLSIISSGIDEKIRYLKATDIELSDTCIDDYVCVQASDYADHFDSSIEFELTFTAFSNGIDKQMVIKKAGEVVYTLSDSLKMMNYSGNTDGKSYSCLNYKSLEE